MDDAQSKIQEGQIRAFFDDVYVDGCGVVTQRKFHRWFDRERANATFWESVLTKYRETFKGEADDWRLHVGEGDEKYTFILWDGPDKEDPTSGWFQSVEALSKRKASRIKARASRSTEDGGSEQ